MKYFIFSMLSFATSLTLAQIDPPPLNQTTVANGQPCIVNQIIGPADQHPYNTDETRVGVSTGTCNLGLCQGGATINFRRWDGTNATTISAPPGVNSNICSAPLPSPTTPPSPSPTPTCSAPCL